MFRPIVTMLAVTLFLAVGGSNWVSAVTLDEFYGNLVPSGQCILSSKISAYAMRETGIHGSASFGGFAATPKSYAISNGIVVPLIKGSDLSIDMTNDLPSRYVRSTKNNADVVTAHYRYRLGSGQSVNLTGRLRRGPVEWNAGAFVKRQKTYWNYALGLDSTPMYFSNLSSGYNNYYLAWRYLEPGEVSILHEKGLAKIDRPLLDHGQTALETALSFSSGRLTRHSQSYWTPLHDTHYTFSTQLHATPEFVWQYGFSPSVEAQIGLEWKTPFRYKYFYEDYKTPPGSSSSTTQFINGVFHYDHWIEVPLALKVRPSDVMEYQLKVDARYVKQSLDYWEKKENGTQIIYPEKSLDHYNFRPSLEFLYLAGADTPGTHHDIGSHKLLKRGQFLSGFLWQMDATILHKDGAQNFADPYSLYQHPVDFFVAGTEYSAFSSGNNSGSPGNVDPQDYHDLHFNNVQGWRDWFNTRVGVGYRTQARAHQFSLGDISNREFVFRPFLYFDAGIDWMITQRATLELNAHYVPSYRTEIISSVHPEQFKEETRYVVFNARMRITF